MQDNPLYDDVVSDVRAFLEERIEFALEQGIAAERIVVDPGLGFGKTVEHNLQLVAGVNRLAELGFPVVFGGLRARAFSAGSSMTRRRFVARSRQLSRLRRSPTSEARRSFASTTYASTLQALRAAALVDAAARELELDVL